MRGFRFLAAVAAVVFSAVAAPAADPVVLQLPERAAARATVVTVADVAKLSGGDEATRDRIARLDLADFKPREDSLTVTRRVVEYRLQLAGFDRREFQVTGADRTTVALTRRAVTADEVVTAARAELLRRLVVPPESVAVELVRPVAVKLPEVPAGEPVTITAQPRGPLAAVGRAQMDVAITAGGEKVLSLAVLFEVKPTDVKAPDVGLPGAVVPAGGIPTAQAQPPATGAVLVRPRQRVSMQVRSGELTVTAVGEAQQEGRLGQSILVQNVDSKKMITAKVTGPGTVEIELPH